MKRFFALCLAVLLLLSASFAEPEPTNAPHDGDLPKYISLGDEGLPIARLLHLIGCSVTSYSGPEQTGDPVFDESSQQYLIRYQQLNELMPSGCFDAETICFALGTVYEDLSLVWIPMHGGKRFHKKESCSNMIEPRQLPLCGAEWLEFTPCGRCCKD